jgi:NitT/TauT family transport system substrate-binding protein
MGNSWGHLLAQCKGDAALSWEGLRAQWRRLGFDYEYLLGRQFSKFPPNSFIIRRADFEDAAKKEFYETYLRGWAMGLEFGHQNPRAATHIVMTQFPGLQQLSSEVATESLMELANAFRGDFGKRQGWGWHDLEAWRLLLKTIKDIKQIAVDINADESSTTTMSRLRTISTRSKSRPRRMLAILQRPISRRRGAAQAPLRSLIGASAA